jgi:hypothetical protein
MLAMSGSQDNRNTSENRGERQYLCPHQGTVGDAQKQDIEERTLKRENKIEAHKPHPLNRGHAI